MESLNVKNINDEKIFNVIDPNGQGEVVNRIRPISISINQKAETINNETDSTINLSVYWNDTWKSILDLTFDESLRQEYGKLTQDLTNIQKDIDMKQYKDAETKTADFLKYVANLSSKYTAIPEKAVVSKIKNDFVKIKADKNSVKVAISDKLLNFMLKKYAKVDNLDYTKSNECFSTSKFNCLANNYDIYYHSPEIFQKQAYMTVVKDNKVVGSYKVNYDQFSKFAAKFMLTPQKLGYSKDRLAGYMKTAEVVMQNIFFDSVDEAKEWQEMVDEKKKEQATTPEGEEETTETTTTETKTEMGEGKSESPIKEDGGLARPSEDFASDEIPESEPRQQDQQGGGQNLGASRRINLLKKKAKVGYNAKPENMEEEVAIELADELMSAANVALEKAGLLWGGYSGEEQRRQRVDVQKNAIEPLLKGRLKESIQGKVIDLIKEHLTDLNYHTLVSAIEEIMDGKQASTEVKLNKKADTEFLNEWTQPEENELDKDDIQMIRDRIEIERDFGPSVYEKEELDMMKHILSVLNTPQDVRKLSQEEKKFIQDKMEVELVYARDGVYEEDDHKRLTKIFQSFVPKTKEELKQFMKKQLEWFKYSWDSWKENHLEDLKGIVTEEEAKQIYNELLEEKNKQSSKTKKLNKKALYGDVQEQDIVPAKTETKVYLQSEDKESKTEKCFICEKEFPIKDMKKEKSVGYMCNDCIDKMKANGYGLDIESLKKAKKNKLVTKKAEEQTVEEKIEEAETSDIVKGKIGVGDIVTICIDKLEYPEEAFKYTELIGEPLILMENDKEDINKVIVEQTEYPFQRMTVNKDDICQYAEIKGVDVIVEDTDGDEMITTFEELPVVAKQCKIKSIHKAATKKKANLTKKAINSLEDVAGLIDDILSDYDWYDYADQLEVGEKSHYENILADLQKDEKGTIEALFNRVHEDDEEYSSPKIEQLKEYYNNKFSNGGK